MSSKLLNMFTNTRKGNDLYQYDRYLANWTEFMHIKIESSDSNYAISFLESIQIISCTHRMLQLFICKENYIMHRYSEKKKPLTNNSHTIRFCIETMQLTRVQYQSKNETFSCINTIKFNWVVYERTMKSCNLIMIIGLIWLDDNFPIWMCARNFIRENSVERTSSEQNLHNVQFYSKRMLLTKQM